MMQLGLMKRFFDSVDEEWRSPVADQIASAWVDAGSDVRILRASANFVCRVETGGSRTYLRFNHASERTPEAIGGELAFIRHLSARGVRAAQPLPSRAGRLIESLQTDLGIFHAVMFEALPGVHLEIDALDEHGFVRWGRSLAQLHLAARNFTPCDRPGWQDWLNMAQAVLPEAERAARRELGDVEQALNNLALGDSFGMIHFDYELDNICWDRGAPAVLDFDDCGPHWFAADIAFALRDLFHDRSSGINLLDERFQAFVAGYRQVRPISEADLGRMALFLRWHNLVSFARITRACSGGPSPDEPEWLQKLRRRLRDIQDGYRQEFEAYPLLSLGTPP